MRDRRNGLGLTAGIGGLALLATGCAHNDVLVFGTSTTIGLNVESVSAEGAPSIVLGYEREEAVWMPLVLNGTDSKLRLCAAGLGEDDECTTGSVPVSQAMYRSEITDPNGRVTRDAYSVFASLGARFSGNANEEGVGAGGGLAQFFATGNAAISVARNEALVTALKVESPEGAQAQANAVAAASDNATADSILAGYSAAEIDAARTEADARRVAHERRVDQAMVCASNADGTLRWAPLVDATTYTDAQKAGLKQSTTRQTIRDRLLRNRPLTNAILIAGAQAPFNCSTS